MSSMTHELETVAWIHGSRRPILVEVIVHYEIDDDNRPDIGDIVEACDPENVLNTHLVEGEKSIIYSKLCTEILGNMTDAAEMAADMER